MTPSQEHCAKMLLCALKAAKETIRHQRDVIGSTCNLLKCMELDFYLEAEMEAELIFIGQECERIIQQCKL